MILKLTRTSHAGLRSMYRDRPGSERFLISVRTPDSRTRAGKRCAATERGGRNMRAINFALGEAAAIAAASVALATMSAAAFAQANRTPDISGIWQSVKYSPKLELQGGGDIPYNDKGKALYAKIVAGLKDGSIKDEARHLCVP